MPPAAGARTGGTHVLSRGSREEPLLATVQLGVSRRPWPVRELRPQEAKPENNSAARIVLDISTRYQRMHERRTLETRQGLLPKAICEFRLEILRAEVRKFWVKAPGLKHSKKANQTNAVHHALRKGLYVLRCFEM